MTRQNEFVAFLYAAAHQDTIESAKVSLGSHPKTFEMYERIADAAEDFIETHRAEVLLTMEEHDARVSAAVAAATARYAERMRRLEQGIVNLVYLMADAGNLNEAAKVMEQLGELT